MRRAMVWSENVLRRFPWVIPLVALIPCAWFAARGANDLLAAQLFAADTTSLARPLPAARAGSEPEGPADHHARDRQAMIHRNIFDSSDAACLDCDAGNPEAGVGDGAIAGAPENNEDLLPPEACYRIRPTDGRVRPGPCDSQGKVMGAVESDDPLWSFVLIAAQQNQPATPFRMGQTYDNRTVGMISWCPALGSFVLLRPAGGQRCFLAQNMPPREAPPTPVVAAAPAAAPPAGGTLASIVEGIERVGGNEFNVRRSTVDRILESQAELMRTTRIMPHEEGGRVVGVQLFGVRGNSLLGRLGMQNGDVLNRINGLEIASPDRALEAYSRLRTSDHLQISVTRNGQPVNIDFHIR